MNKTEKSDISSGDFLHRLPKTIINKLDTKDINHLGLVISNFINEKQVDYVLGDTKITEYIEQQHYTEKRGIWNECEIQRYYNYMLQDGLDGDNSSISALAYQFFNDWCIYNEPHLVKCLLIHSDDPNGVKYKDLSYPLHYALHKETITQGMRWFKWKDGCIWEEQKEAFQNPTTGNSVAIHYVVLCLSTFTSVVMVDWSIVQFNIDSLKNALLFLPEKHNRIKSISSNTKREYSCNIS
jgi:hypothetical protein